MLAVGVGVGGGLVAGVGDGVAVDVEVGVGVAVGIEVVGRALVGRRGCMAWRARGLGGARQREQSGEWAKGWGAGAPPRPCARVLSRGAGCQRGRRPHRGSSDWGSSTRGSG